MRHDEAWTRLPDLLDDRDDPATLAHVRACADCQRQLFLLGRVDRLLRDSAAGRAVRPPRRPSARSAVAAAVVAVAVSALAAFFVVHQGRRHELMFRTGSGQAVGEATMGRSDGRNVSLALDARDLPVDRGQVFVLWADDDARSSMQVGHFMVDRRGACRVRFNLPASHTWREFRITRPGSRAVIAST